MSESIGVESGSRWSPGVARSLVAQCAGFLLMVFGADLLTDRLGLQLAAVTKSSKASYQLLAFAKSRDSVDAVIIGSSAVEKGINPVQGSERLSKLLDRTIVFYGLGIAGLRTTLLADILEELVPGKQPGSLLIVAIEPRSFCRAVGRGMEPIAVPGEWEEQRKDSTRIELFNGLRAAWQIPATLTPTSRDRIRSISDSLGADAGKSMGWAPEGERRAELNLRKANDEESPAQETIWAWCEPDSVEFRDWNRALAALDRLTCPVLVIKMPFAEGFEEEKMPGTSELFQSQIVPDLKRRGIEFMDLGRPPFPSKPIFFADGFHLTKLGRRTATKALVDEVLLPRMK